MSKTYFTRKEQKNSKDFYPTPAWATRAFFEFVIPKLPAHMYNPRMSCWEPACGQGHMVKVLDQHFAITILSDIENRGYGMQLDFLGDTDLLEADWVITNPPFTNEMPMKFVHKARTVARKGIAIFARAHLLEGKERYQYLFSKYPPMVVAQFVERVTLVKNEVTSKSSSVTPYAWFVWGTDHVAEETKLIWIPPCKKILERESDYYNNEGVYK